MTNTNISTVVFVDSNVADYQSLVNSVEPGTKVVVLDANRNGVEQITAELANHDNLDSIQILSHGDSASLQLGNSSLNDGNIESHASQLQQWGEALSIDGDILLYGCNVAEGERGQAFINRLGEITEADIAASEDLTGNSELGGDWVLEATTGFIEAPLAFQVDAMSAFNSVLQTFIVTNANDSGEGSLRQAILEAENNNNSGTVDIIEIDPGLTINLRDSLPTISQDVEIRGNGAVIDGSNQHQILAINGIDSASEDTQIILSDLSLTDGRVRGSRGFRGGGGGLGAGGALFINNGTVIANNVDFTDNSAAGGNIGAGLGGAIFIQNEADLILLNSNFSGNSTTGGTGANNGQGRGNDIFIRGDATVSQSGTAIADVFGDVGAFILPTINIAPGDNLSESNPDANGFFNLSLDRALPIDLVFNYTITGTAINDPDRNDEEEIAGADVSIPLSVTIPAGETTGSIDVEVIDDRLFDPNENIIVTLEDSPLYNLGDSISAELTIVDDEPDISLDATDAIEGVNNGQFIFNLAPNAPEGRSLSFRITGGTAELDTDYQFLDADGEVIVTDEEGNFFLDISGEEQVVVQLDATGIPGGIPDFDDGVAEGNETVEITLNESEEYGGCGRKCHRS